MKKILSIIFAVVIGGFMLVTPTFISRPAFAGKCGDVDTAIIDCNGDDENGGINHILNLVVNIMMVLAGILAVIGITVVGTQYLTAGGNEEQTRKAKRRLVEIVIGIIAFVLIYALLSWLLPGFKPIGS